MDNLICHLKKLDKEEKNQSKQKKAITDIRALPIKLKPKPTEKNENKIWLLTKVKIDC
jgi:hypothetical protein